MATLTATRRVIPSQIQTPSQNTAPVHEFRCLFTHDIFKKAKKWHDGSLRFHTFNKRVMVYDDSKNYIGDLHYRQEEDFGEGLELQLDKGVKVEVGERIGETQTDLAPLLERRRPEEPSEFAGTHRTSIPGFRSANAIALAHQRPRSIADVLGAGKGRNASSRLPLQSPYERRLNTADGQEPAAKRQKMVSVGEKENHEPAETRPQMRQSSQPKGLQAKKQIPLHTNDPLPLKVTEVLDISSDDDAGSRRKTAKVKEKVDKHVQNSRRPVVSSEMPTVTAHAQSSPPNIYVTKSAKLRMETTHSRPELRNIAEKRVSAIHYANRPPPQIHGESTKLLLPIPQPRTKLMYKALLPSERSKPSAIISSRTRSFKPIDLDDDDDDSQQEPLMAAQTNSVVRTSPAPEVCPEETSIPSLHAPSTPEQCDANDSIEQASLLDVPSIHAAEPSFDQHSPLFVSQASGQAPPISVCSRSDDFMVPVISPSPVKEVTQQIQVPSTPPLRSSPTSSQMEAVRTTPIQSLWSMRSQVELEPSTPPFTHREFENIITPNIFSPLPDTEASIRRSPVRSLRLPAPFSSRRRPLQRTFSADIGPEALDPMNNSPTRFVMPTALQSLKAKARLAALPKAPDGSRMGRSKSDTDTLIEKTIQTENLEPEIAEGSNVDQSTDKAAEEQEEEKGPWTSMEAYLLFDWWPPNKVKPSYGDVSQLPPTQVPTRIPWKITTAREMLRNEMK